MQQANPQPSKTLPIQTNRSQSVTNTKTKSPQRSITSFGTAVDQMALNTRAYGQLVEPINAETQYSTITYPQQRQTINHQPHPSQSTNDGLSSIIIMSTDRADHSPTFNTLPAPNTSAMPQDKYMKALKEISRLLKANQSLNNKIKELETHIASINPIKPVMINLSTNTEDKNSQKYKLTIGVQTVSKQLNEEAQAKKIYVKTAQLLKQYEKELVELRVKQSDYQTKLEFSKERIIQLENALEDKTNRMVIAQEQQKNAVKELSTITQRVQQAHKVESAEKIVETSRPTNNPQTTFNHQQWLKRMNNPPTDSNESSLPSPGQPYQQSQVKVRYWSLQSFYKRLLRKTQLQAIISDNRRDSKLTKYKLHIGRQQNLIKEMGCLLGWERVGENKQLHRQRLYSQQNNGTVMSSEETPVINNHQQPHIKQQQRTNSSKNFTTNNINVTPNDSVTHERHLETRLELIRLQNKALSQQNIQLQQLLFEAIQKKQIESTSRIKQIQSKGKERHFIGQQMPPQRQNQKSFQFNNTAMSFNDTRQLDNSNSIHHIFVHMFNAIDSIGSQLTDIVSSSSNRTETSRMESFSSVTTSQLELLRHKLQFLLCQTEQMVAEKEEALGIIVLLAASLEASKPSQTEVNISNYSYKKQISLESSTQQPSNSNSIESMSQSAVATATIFKIRQQLNNLAQNIREIDDSIYVRSTKADTIQQVDNKSPIGELETKEKSVSETYNEWKTNFNTFGYQREGRMESYPTDNRVQGYQTDIRIKGVETNLAKPYQDRPYEILKPFQLSWSRTRRQ